MFKVVVKKIRGYISSLTIENYQFPFHSKTNFRFKFDWSLYRFWGIWRVFKIVEKLFVCSLFVFEWFKKKWIIIVQQKDELIAHLFDKVKLLSLISSKSLKFARMKKMILKEIWIHSKVHSFLPLSSRPLINNQKAP